MTNLIFIFSRILQVMAIILLAYALYFGIALDSMAREMMLLCIGGIIFYIGWLLQKRV